MGKGPGGKHENMRTYSPEEAQFVHRLVQEYHPQWTLIAKKVSEAFACERSAASVRNYYKRFQQSQATMLKGMAKNRCQLCNQIKRGHICTPMQATPRARVGSSGDENLVTNNGAQSMEVEVMGLAKPLAPDNGFMALGGMFDDIIFPTAGSSPRPAPAAHAQPNILTTTAAAAPRAAHAAPVVVVEPPARRAATCIPTVEVGAEERRVATCIPTVEVEAEEPRVAACIPTVEVEVLAEAPMPAVPVAPPPPVLTFDETLEKVAPPALASASSLLALSASPLPRFSLPSPEDASIPA